MAFVPIHVWKVPLKYGGMLSALSEPLGLRLRQGNGHHGVREGGYKMAGTKNE